MMYPQSGTRTVRHESDRESWSFALRSPVTPLRGLVDGYCLYEERRPQTQAHQHLPHRGVTFIIGLEGRMHVEDPGGGRRRVAEGEGFVAGLHTQPARTRMEGSQRGLQITLTPIATHLLAGGLPMGELSNHSVSVGDLLGADGRALSERLAEENDADAAYDLVDAFLSKRILGSRRRLADEVVYAWNQLASSHGRTRIGEITGRLGWSRRRLVEAFRAAVGLDPKLTARVLRFDRAMSRWKAAPQAPWAELAIACGFSDQAHFSREVRALSGQSPSELARRLLPGSGGMVA